MARTLETDVIDMPEKVMPETSRDGGSEKAQSENKAPKASASRLFFLAFSIPDGQRFGGCGATEVARVRKGGSSPFAGERPKSGPSPLGFPRAPRPRPGRPG